MTLVTLFFFAHQPERLRYWGDRSRVSDISPAQLPDYYFDDAGNRFFFEKVAKKCYWPATTLLRDLLHRHKNDEKPFKFAFALSGTLLDQMRRYDPALLKVFQEVAQTGLCEFTGETYYHSLAGLFDERRDEFKEQAQLHARTIEELFGRKPTVFRNTECMYNNGVAKAAQDLGYRGIVTEGLERVLGPNRSPDFVYRAPTGLPVLLRNYKLSDDIGYRFSNKAWDCWPLSAQTFAGWVAQNTDPCTTLALDYEALGEHMWEDTGIFGFINDLPRQMARYPQLQWATPTEVVERIPSVGEYSVDDFSTISWADQERDTSAWLVNEMQQLCFEQMKRLEPLIRETQSPDFLLAWRRMLTSDHLYYICDKNLSDGDVHKYFSAYGSVAEAFVRLHTALVDLMHRAERYMEKQGKPADIPLHTESETFGLQRAG
jgi:alpha-amylase